MLRSARKRAKREVSEFLPETLVNLDIPWKHSFATTHACDLGVERMPTFLVFEQDGRALR